MLAVWLAVARTPASDRPILMATTGFPMACARRAAARKVAGSRTASRNSSTTPVRGSSTRCAKKSAAVRSTSLPVLTTWLNGSASARPRLYSANPMPPLCATTPIARPSSRGGGGPTGGATVGLKVMATLSSALKKPSAFGPHTRMPVRRAISATRSCNAALAPPSSAKPEEMMTAWRTPAAAQDSSDSGTRFAGKATTARSISAPISPIFG